MKDAKNSTMFPDCVKSSNSNNEEASRTVNEYEDEKKTLIPKVTFSIKKEDPMMGYTTRSQKAMTRNSDDVLTPEVVQSNNKVKRQRIEKIAQQDIKLTKQQRPTPEECFYAVKSLSKLHPYVVDRNDERRKTLLESCGMNDSITDAIISTMLSQNTTDKNSKAAFKTLKERFYSDSGGWEAIVDCEDISEIENAIKVAGLAKTRAIRIQEMLRTVKNEKGTVSLSYIQSLTDEEVKTELGRFKGLGPKTISCVLLFALGRKEFPVDTHVLRISQKLGWVPSKSTRNGAYDYLNEIIPDYLKMDLHCLLVEHGKRCHFCAANSKPQFPPSDGSKLICPLKEVSTWKGVIPDNVDQDFVKKENKSAYATSVDVKKEV